jgi:uncharacterized membrane protein YdjX (TVP38/TMEM64 family)
MSLSTLARTVLLLVILGAIVAALVLVPTRAYARPLLESVQGRGLAGAVGLVLLYVPVSMLFLPGMLLTLGAGFLYGPLWGALIATTGVTLAAAVTLFVGRFLARPWVERTIATHPAFVAIDRAIANEGFKAVLLMRLCPFFPFSAVNYLCGVTKIPMSRYVLATWVGRIPGLSTTAYVGSAARSLADAASGNVPLGRSQQVLLVLGLVLMIVVLAFIAQVANRLLRETLRTPPTPPLPLRETGRAEDS